MIKKKWINLKINPVNVSTANKFYSYPYKSKKITSKHDLRVVCITNKHCDSMNIYYRIFN